MVVVVAARWGKQKGKGERVAAKQSAVALAVFRGVVERAELDQRVAGRDDDDNDETALACRGTNAPQRPAVVVAPSIMITNRNATATRRIVQLRKVVNKHEYDAEQTVIFINEGNDRNKMSPSLRRFSPGATKR